MKYLKIISVLFCGSEDLACFLFPVSFKMSQCDLQHIDQIMSSHGKQIMQAVTLILEADHSIEVKEQVNTNTCSSTRCCWMFASCRFSAGKCQPCENWILGFFPQTLCILANIADGNTAKDLIVSNDDMLQKVKYYMVNNRTCGSHVVKVRCLALTNWSISAGAFQCETAARRHLLHLQPHLERRGR